MVAPSPISNDLRDDFEFEERNFLVATLRIDKAEEIPVNETQIVVKR